MTILMCLLLSATTQLDLLTNEVAESGRVLQMVQSPSERVSVAPQIAPGAPPVLAFRYFEGKDRHHFGDNDLMLDDAGH